MKWNKKTIRSFRAKIYLPSKPPIHIFLRVAPRLLFVDGSWQFRGLQRLRAEQPRWAAVALQDALVESLRAGHATGKAQGQGSSLGRWGWRNEGKSSMEISMGKESNNGDMMGIL